MLAGGTTALPRAFAYRAVLHRGLVGGGQLLVQLTRIVGFFEQRRGRRQKRGVRLGLINTLDNTDTTDLNLACRTPRRTSTSFQAIRTLSCYAESPVKVFIIKKKCSCSLHPTTTTTISEQPDEGLTVVLRVLLSNFLGPRQNTSRAGYGAFAPTKTTHQIAPVVPDLSV